MWWWWWWVEGAVLLLYDHYRLPPSFPPAPDSHPKGNRDFHTKKLYLTIQRIGFL